MSAWGPVLSTEVLLVLSSRTVEEDSTRLIPAALDTAVPPVSDDIFDGTVRALCTRGGEIN